MVLAALFQRGAGTTLVAAHYKGGIIVGADSRSSRGSFVASRHATKVTPVARHVVVARSGSAADTQRLAEHVAAALRMAEMSDYLSGGGGGGYAASVRSAAHVLSRAAYAGKGHLSAALLCAGWDPLDGMQLFSCPQGGALLPSGSFAIAGSGAPSVLG